MLSKQALALIELSEQLLVLIKAEEEDVELLAKLESRRDQQIRQLFSDHTQDALAQEISALERIRELDSQIQRAVAARKQALAGQLASAHKGRSGVAAYSANSLK